LHEINGNPTKPDCVAVGIVAAALDGVGVALVVAAVCC